MVLASIERKLLGVDSTSPTLSEKTRSALALIVVTSTLAVIFASLFVFRVDDTMKFAGVLTGIIGLVLGFYFGKQGLNKAQKSLVTAQKDVERAKALVSNADAERNASEAEARNVPEFKAVAEAGKVMAKKYAKAMRFIKDQELEDSFARSSRDGG
ncbi:MAG: hypothetical protein V3W28_07290 [Thermoplasmata archaeon]